MKYIGNYTNNLYYLIILRKTVCVSVFIMPLIGILFMGILFIFLKFKYLNKIGRRSYSILVIYALNILETQTYTNSLSLILISNWYQVPIAPEGQTMGGQTMDRLKVSLSLKSFEKNKIFFLFSKKFY